MKTRCINLKDHESIGLLDGSITALWRPVKPAPVAVDFLNVGGGVDWPCAVTPAGRVALHCPYQRGDTLIGREKHAVWHDGDKSGAYFWADQGAMHQVPKGSWRSASEMPAALARHRLKVVSVECLQGEQRPMEGSIMEWEAQRKEWFWKLSVEALK